jgi:hypothetical protein
MHSKSNTNRNFYLLPIQDVVSTTVISSRCGLSSSQHYYQMSFDDQTFLTMDEVISIMYVTETRKTSEIKSKYLRH